MDSLRPVFQLYERFVLRRALRRLHPSHPAVPQIVRRLADQKHAPSPLDPADGPVTGFCILLTLAVLAWALVFGGSK